MSDKLTDTNTRHWTGSEQALSGLVGIDGTNYRYMGATPRQIPAMPQVASEVSALHTNYRFEAAGISLSVSFFAPAFPRDLEVLSRPVTYLSWVVSSTDWHLHSVTILLDVDPRVAVNSPDEEVAWGRSKTPNLEVLSVGSRDQRILSRAGDNLRIDWGYFLSRRSRPRRRGARHFA